MSQPDPEITPIIDADLDRDQDNNGIPDRLESGAANDDDYTVDFDLDAHNNSPIDGAARKKAAFAAATFVEPAAANDEVVGVGAAEPAMPVSPDGNETAAGADPTAEAAGPHISAVNEAAAAAAALIESSEQPTDSALEAQRKRLQKDVGRLRRGRNGKSSLFKELSKSVDAKPDDTGMEAMQSFWKGLVGGVNDARDRLRLKRLVELEESVLATKEALKKVETLESEAAGDKGAIKSALDGDPNAAAAGGQASHDEPKDAGAAADQEAEATQAGATPQAADVGVAAEPAREPAGSSADQAPEAGADPASASSAAEPVTAADPVSNSTVAPSLEGSQVAAAPEQKDAHASSQPVTVDVTENAPATRLREQAAPVGAVQPQTTSKDSPANTVAAGIAAEIAMPMVGSTITAGQAVEEHSSTKSEADAVQSKAPERKIRSIGKGPAAREQMMAPIPTQKDAISQPVIATGRARIQRGGPLLTQAASLQLPDEPVLAKGGKRAAVRTRVIGLGKGLASFINTARAAAANEDSELARVNLFRSMQGKRDGRSR